jgi:hypothetical protein
MGRRNARKRSWNKISKEIDLSTFYQLLDVLEGTNLQVAQKTEEQIRPKMIANLHAVPLISQNERNICRRSLEEANQWS